MRRSVRTAALSTTSALLLALAAPAAGAAAAPAPRIDLKVLVVDDGGPATAAIAAELDGSGTPYTLLDLPSGGPPGDRRGLPRRHRGRAAARQVPGRGAAQRQPVRGGLGRRWPRSPRTRRASAIPQVDAYTYARPEVGLELPGQRRLQRLAGRRAGRGHGRRQGGPLRLSRRAGPLRGQLARRGRELRLHVAQPAAGADFTSYVDAPLPGSQQRGSHRRRVPPRRPPRTRRHLRLQPVPAAVPAARPRHRRTG